MPMDKAGLLARAAAVTGEVRVTGFPEPVVIRKISAGELYELSALGDQPDNGRPRDVVIGARLLEFGLSDSEGNRMLEDGDGLKLFDAHGIDTVNELAAAINSHNGMGEDADDAEKN